MIATLLKKALHKFGFDLVRHQPSDQQFPRDVSPEDRELLTKVQPFTMTSFDRQLSVLGAVRHVVDNNVAGSIVECGVWRGGSSMLAALALKQLGQTDRQLYLYDTFEGMTEPTDADKTSDGKLAQTHLDLDPEKTGVWCVAGLDDVQANLASTDYPVDHVHFVQGPVEETIPATMPEAPIALLRLDTDWYESTKHELEHLFPLLSENGVLIIDDYGHWEGARQAVDEYLAKLPTKYFLHRIDYTGRIMIKR